MDGYDLEQEDDVRIFHVTDDNTFDLNNYVMIDSDDETELQDPEEAMNSFRITLADGGYDIENVELLHNNENSTTNGREMSLNLRPEYLREADGEPTPTHVVKESVHETQTRPSTAMPETNGDRHMKEAASKQHTLSGGDNE